MIPRAAVFVLHGRPQTYKPPRHRFGQKHFYCGHKKEIKAARKVLEKSWSPRESLSGVAVKLVVRACGVHSPHFARPKSHFKKGRLRLNAPTHVLKVPDVDNLAKFVLDAVQKKILTDDRFVSTLVVHKRWCLKEDQRTEVELWLLA